MDWDKVRKVCVTYVDMKGDGKAAEMYVESSRQAMPRRIMQALAKLVGAPFVMAVKMPALGRVMHSVIGDPGMMQGRLFEAFVRALEGAVTHDAMVVLSSGSGKRSVRLVGLDEVPYASPEPQEDRCVALPVNEGWQTDGTSAGTGRAVQVIRDCF